MSDSDRSLVLVLSNDLSLAAAKTSRHLCLALTQLGFGAIGRDTRLIRWAASEVEKESPTRREAYETLVVAKWDKFIFDYGIDTIISLDLHWLFSSRLFVSNNKVKRIHSFWFDDLRSHLQSAPMFSLAPHSPLELINGSKISHHCYGHGQAEELRLLGVERVLPSALAAPAEFLQAAEPCTELRRLAFIGNPGLSSAPTHQALAAMERGENLATLRRVARQEILDGLSTAEPTTFWIRQSPGVADLLAAAIELRLSRPHVSAISLLTQAGRSYPESFDFLNRNDLILDAALLIKFVNRYDRPGLVRRLWRRGWLDVYGAPEQWALYGITAHPTIPFPRLASVYRRHPGHLNAANCTRDAAANEKLFEIAACGRLSLNLDNPDVRACYSNDEIILAESDEALEAAAEQVLRDPAGALALGEKARLRTANEHLWEHRLGKALA
jgi:Glycosyl transferases group 1